MSVVGVFSTAQNLEDLPTTLKKYSYLKLSTESGLRVISICNQKLELFKVGEKIEKSVVVSTKKEFL